MTQTDLILGDLEVALLEELWATEKSDAQSIHRRIGKARGISLSTIQSTLERLCRKAVLCREKVGHAYVYAPALSRRAVTSRLVDAALKHFKQGHPEGMLAAFADYAAADERMLNELERLITARKAELKGAKRR